MEESSEKSKINSAVAQKEGNTPDAQKRHEETEISEKNILDTKQHHQDTEVSDGNTPDVKKQHLENEVSKDMMNTTKKTGDRIDVDKDPHEIDVSVEKKLPSADVVENTPLAPKDHKESDVSAEKELNTTTLEKELKDLGEIIYPEDEAEPIFDGTEEPRMEPSRSLSGGSSDHDAETQGYAWPEKAVALTNFVKEKGATAVSTVLRRLSSKGDKGVDVPDAVDKNIPYSTQEREVHENSQKPGDKTGWNRLNFFGISRDVGDSMEEELVQESTAMKGRILLYTRSGCQECKDVRIFLHKKRLRYVEINIDVYPSRKMELEKIAGSSAVPKVFFNELHIGGLNVLTNLDESGKLDEKIDYIVSEAPSFEAPLPPLSGEDDVSTSGEVDEYAVIVQKMRDVITVKDHFYKMRRFTNCFLGSEAVDFLSEDQYLEREEAVEFGRKLASLLFFHHVLDENVFEDGNHLYRFLDHDPMVSQCQNIVSGISKMKLKPIVDVSSRLRFLSSAILEAYTSPDGKHVDYRSIHGSEEFARYLRILEELQRVDLHDMPREEKLAFFINLYNMMAIHAILVCGHPTGALERRKLFGDFKYVVGGCAYSLSAIHNGILRGNQRPPYNLIKPFAAKDRRFKVALPYPEPLINFTLVSGHRSDPALRCYTPGNIDKEMAEAACDFLRSGGFIIDFNAKIASVSKILKWYNVDFGKNDIEVWRHAANYLEPPESQALLELLANTQLKVVYQPYDWGLNY